MRHIVYIGDGFRFRKAMPPNGAITVLLSRNGAGCCQMKKNVQMPCTAPLWFDNRDILRLVNAVLCAPSAEAFAECIPVFVKAFCVRHVFGISKRQPAAERRIHHVAVNQSADSGEASGAHLFGYQL